jgi:hypothetical protein
VVSFFEESIDYQFLKQVFKKMFAPEKDGVGYLE